MRQFHQVTSLAVNFDNDTSKFNFNFWVLLLLLVLLVVLLLVLLVLFAVLFPITFFLLLSDLLLVLLYLIGEIQVFVPR